MKAGASKPAVSRWVAGGVAILCLAASGDLTTVLGTLKDAEGIYPLPFTRPLDVGVVPEVSLLSRNQALLYPGTVELQMVRALGMLPADYPINRVTRELAPVAAVYEEGSHTLLLQQDVPASPPAQLDLVAALALAAADPSLNLAEYREADTLDGRMARRAVIEGLALTAVTRYRDRQHWNEVPANARLLRPVLSTTPPYLALRRAMPELAGRRLLKEFPLGDLSARPPASTEQVLHPEKYLAKEAPVVLQWSSSLSFSVAETLGEMLCPAVLLPWNQGLPTAVVDDANLLTPCAGWAGDRLLLGDAGAVWITAWDTEVDRQEFQRVYERAHPASQHFSLGSRVEIYGFGLSEQNWETTRKGRLMASQGDQSWMP